MKYFQDLREGLALSCAPVTITRAEIIDFANRFDPQPFHVNEQAARESIFGGLVASSLHTLSACTRSVVEAMGPTAILSGVGLHEVAMFNPVRPGDTLLIEAFWSDLKRSRSKPDRGFASVMCRVTNPKGERIVEYGYRYLIACGY
jgi:acyl dehydratase